MRALVILGWYHLAGILFYREPEFGMEHHSPVIYLDLNIEDMTPRHSDDDVPVAELAFLDKEMNTTFLPLPVVTVDNNVSSILTSWDSSVHDSIHLNRLTPHNERIYMIVKVSLRLSHPAPVDVTLRKRICVNIYKHQSLTMKLRKKINKTANVSHTRHCKTVNVSHTRHYKTANVSRTRRCKTANVSQQSIARQPM